MTDQERWARTVEADDEANLIEVASASTDDLRRAHEHHREVAARLRSNAAWRGKQDAVSAEWVREAKQHDGVMVRLYAEITARGERLTD